MSSYKINPVTNDELLTWHNNTLVNPRTNRKIKKFSKTYNYLEKHYKKMTKNSENKNKSSRNILLDNENINKLVQNYQGPAKGNHLKSCDNKDPISQEDIWCLSNTEKTVCSDIPSIKLFSYLDSEDKIRCFNIESIITLINTDCIKHPITGLEIDSKSIDNAKNMYTILKENNIIIEEEDNRTIEKKISDYAFSVFQKFSLISVFIEHEWFLKLNDSKLDKLYYETSDFYFQNVSLENKKIMVPPDGKAFVMSRKDFEKIDLNEKRKYILENIDKIISSSKDEGMKTLGYYLMIGGLGVVCKEIREKYPDFAYGFTID